mgnify:CR=1 FL=1
MKNVISFSGGKDSLALLYLLEPLWHDTTVLWCNPGAPYDETVEMMAQVRRLVPHFLEVRSDVFGFIDQRGWPADLAPAFAGSLAAVALYGAKARYCSTLECCSANIWAPSMEAVKKLGATTVYRGQKRCDDLKSPVIDGQVIDGITYRFPLAGWTDRDVIEFLGDRLPAYYAAGETSSRDCWCCTGYLAHNAQRIRSLSPERRAVVVPVLRDLSDMVSSGADDLAACLKDC